MFNYIVLFFMLLVITGTVLWSIKQLTKIS